MDPGEVQGDREKRTSEPSLKTHNQEKKVLTGHSTEGCKPNRRVLDLRQEGTLQGPCEFGNVLGHRIVERPIAPKKEIMQKSGSNGKGGMQLVEGNAVIAEAHRSPVLSVRGGNGVGEERHPSVLPDTRHNLEVPKNATAESRPTPLRLKPTLIIPLSDVAAA